MRGLYVLCLSASSAGCALVAGLGDFVPAGEAQTGGQGAGGSASSVGATGGIGGVATGGQGGGGMSSSSGGGASSTTTGGASCSDMNQNGDETDVDCGGPLCNACVLGKKCLASTDCVSGVCSGTCSCSDHLVISEVRTRNVSSASDEFVELYNGTASSIVVDDTWTLQGRASGGSNYTARWTGPTAGFTIPPFHHLLIVGSNYSDAVAADSTLTSSVTDAASIFLAHGTTVVDALCYCYNAGSCSAIEQPGYTCEGAPATNANTDTSPGTNMSMERLAMGLSGNCVDTGDNAQDFVANLAPNPQDLLSGPTP